MTDPLIFVRGVHFAATLAACGTIGFIRLVAEPAKIPGDFQPLRSRLSVLILLALVLAILSGAVWLVLIAADILGAPLIDVCLHGGAWPVLFETRFGLVWCTRFALALVLVLSLLRPIPEAFQLATAALLLCLPATVGHAGATPGLTGDIHLASDVASADGRSVARQPAGVCFVALAGATERKPRLGCFRDARYPALFDRRHPQRQRFAWERIDQQLEPAGWAARSLHNRLRAPDSAESRTVYCDARDCRGE